MSSAIQTNGNAHDYEEDKRRIASAIPYYPFKGIDRFYDISGLLMAPALFKRTTDILVQRYREMGIDKIGGFDARGFVLGPPLALELQIPFFMLRKKSKMPNAICGEKYSKEYEGDGEDGSDSLCISRTALLPGDRVLLIDDLIATGGTLLAGVELVKQQQAQVVEAACMIELTYLDGGKKVREKHPEVKVWSFISEEHLQTAGTVADDNGVCTRNGMC